MDALGHERFAVVGHDTGFAIGYALAADHPDRVDRAALAEIPGPPGATPPPPLFVPAPLNNRLWHIPFNRVENAARAAHRRDARTSTSATSSPSRAARCPDDVVDYYVGLLSDPDVLTRQPRVLPGVRRHRGAERAAQEPAAAMPVLAIGGETSYGDHVAEAMKPSPRTCRAWSSPAPATGSPRRRPSEMLAALTAFLAPYRDRAAAAGDRAAAERSGRTGHCTCPARRRDRVAQLRATRSRRAARPRRPRELLDADLHQLAAPGAVRAGWSQRTETTG